METIYIKKLKNGYTVELGFLNDADDEIYLYKTKEELVAALPELIERAHKFYEEQKAKKEEKGS